MRNLEETFRYDDQNRLTEIRLGAVYSGTSTVVEKRGGEETLHYILKDNLGSWTTVTDSEGNVEQRLSYDAWGSLRNPGTWSGSFTGKPMLDRGFTGHEHLTAFGLINMKFTLSERSAKLCLSTAERCELGGANGRMYDPVMSSFFSVGFWPISGIYLATDIGVLLFTGQSIGEHIDNWVGGPVVV